ncbi:MAG: heavy metal translocating P-type ATPase [SAR324 cluster bacterium]|nr:heavy metal translocating P-type ATPase [SAR324 cluster bacterium]
MFWIPLIVIGSTLYTGLKTYRHLKEETDKPVSSSEEANKHESPLSYVSKVDEKYQTFISHKIDPLFGSIHHQQMETVSLNQETVDEEEKILNRQIALSAITVGTTLFGAWFLPPLLLLSVASASYLVMIPVYKEIYTSIVEERRVKTDFIVGLYLTGMLATGYYVLFSVQSLLFFASNKLIYRTEDRSRKDLVSVFGLQPRFVWRLVGEVEIETPFEELQSGDMIVVNAGEMIPADGTITKGFCSIDQHILTGEAQPVEKETGDLIFASTLVLTGRITVKVEKAGSETAAAHIGDILNRMADYRVSMESKGIELSDKTALPLLLTSGMALPVIGKVGATSILGSGFGFNMRIIAPISMLNFLNLASRNGILVKDGRALERLQEVDTFVFDKTGTLTLEQPHVAKVHLNNSLSENELLTYAAAAEYRQTHPIAKAILMEADQRKLQLPQIDEAHYEVGYGIKVGIDKQLVRVGSDRFMAMEGIELSPEMKELNTLCQEQGHSLVMVALDDELAGIIELHSTIRPEAKTMIQQLQQRNLSVSIISGDQEEPTRELARELGIDHYFANILPENKAGLIEQLQQKGHSVCFVGDGINDAIALKQANVSISLLGASTVAVDTAQIVLMDQSLKQLNYLLDLTKEFDGTIRTGFITTLIPGLICIGGVFFLHFGIIASEILFQLGLFSGLGVAMKPLLKDKKKGRNETDGNRLLV